MRRRDFIRTIAALAAARPVAALAQKYPSRPITMVVPFAAGGAFDVLGRILAARMGEILGQQIIIENTTGGAGIIGVNRVVNAAPDGYTLLLGSIGTHAYNQTIYKKPRYNAVADFTPVALFAEQPMVLDTRKDFPADNLAQFIAYVKANSAKLQFGSAGAGTTTHLGCALLNAAIGVNVTHVPYRGGGPAANDLMGGQIDYFCSNIGASLPLILGKRIKALAMLSRSRSPLMPDLPTAQEQGLAGFDVVTWNAFFLPRGAPAEVVKKLNEATSEALDTPAIQTRLHDLGIAAVAPERRSPEYLAKLVVEEIARWEGPIKSNGLQVD
ncbi:MAG TPA: tripartite tricarboxylate transporter substrate-binding protein [Xanthobacteraceae bacterium]|jgi:tripartite-type tricarboxylate transporter receptor subunit TctC